MKKLTLLLGLAVLTLGALWLVQSRKAADEAGQAASLRAELASNVAKLNASQSSEELANERVQTLLERTDELSRQLQAQLQATTSAEMARTNARIANEAVKETIPGSASTNQENTGFGDLLSKMMQDPTAKKFLRDQQRMMVDQLYSPLVKEMALSGEESARFKDLLADTMMKNTEKASSLLGGTSSNRTEAVKSLAEEQTGSEADLKAFLGESRYAMYQDYQLTVGERAQLNQFKQMATSENPISDAQVEQLLAIMKQEKQGMAATTGQSFSGSAKDPAQLQAMLSNGEFEKMLQSQEAVNQRVLERANQVLTGDQMEVFGRFQTNQLQMMRFGMSMARKLLPSNEVQSRGAESPDRP
jgi:hypothetical protein